MKLGKCGPDMGLLDVLKSMRGTDAGTPSSAPAEPAGISPDEFAQIWDHAKSSEQVLSEFLKDLPIKSIGKIPGL